MSTNHKHRFPSVQAANAFVCGVNWAINMIYENDVNPGDLEVQDILVGEMFGELVATVVIIEDDGRDDQVDDDHDHADHV